MEFESSRVIISTVVMRNANDILEYNRRRSGLPSEPLDMEHGQDQDQDQDQDQLPSEPLNME